MHITVCGQFHWEKWQFILQFVLCSTTYIDVYVVNESMLANASKKIFVMSVMVLALSALLLFL